jgi:hypothetical protein
MTPTTVRDNLKALSSHLLESSGPDFMYESVEQAIVLLEGWRPIESAPKDGTRVLVYGPRGVLIAWWNTEPTVWERSPRACWSVFTPDDFFYSVHLVEDREKPTHWMPLPEGPK